MLLMLLMRRDFRSWVFVDVLLCELLLSDKAGQLLLQHPCVCLMPCTKTYSALAESRLTACTEGNDTWQNVAYAPCQQIGSLKAWLQQA